MLLNAEDCQLVLVDYQTRLMPAIHGGDEAVGNAVRLAQASRLLGVPVWATEQNPAGLGPTVEALRPHVEGRVIAKTAFGAADVLLPRLQPAARAPQGNARSLPRHLQKAVPAPALEALVLAGCETHVCLLQTALGLLEEEADVWVVTDASSSRTERNRDAAFDRLAAAGAELVTTEMVLFEWLRDAAHPRFKEIQALVK